MRPSLKLSLRCRPGCIPPAQAEALHKCSHPLTLSLSHPFTVSLSHTLTPSWPLLFPPPCPPHTPLNAVSMPPSMPSTALHDALLMPLMMRVCPS